MTAILHVDESLHLTTILVMRVIVDFELCESNALCMAEAPEVFDLDEEDQLHVLLDQPAEDLKPKVEAAARACPKAAITIVD
jgi:ferredoxin